MTKIVVFAYSLVGHACLKALIDAGETSVGVFTHPDTPGESLWFPSVAELAKDHNIPLIATEGPKEPIVLETLRQMQPDLLFSFYYRKMIPGSILEIPKLGCFNMHGSLLPKFRGRAPINWAIIHGEKETGATLHHMVKSADAGAIVDQEAFPIYPTENAFDLTHKVKDAAVRVLVRQLPALKDGNAPAIPQDETKATSFSGRSAKDNQIDWHQTPWKIHNLIRAAPHPYFPPAFTYWKGEKVEVRTNILPQGKGLEINARPGQVIANENDRIRIACGDGKTFLEVTELSRPLSEIHVGDVFTNQS